MFFPFQSFTLWIFTVLRRCSEVNLWSLMWDALVIVFVALWMVSSGYGDRKGS